MMTWVSEQLLKQKIREIDLKAESDIKESEKYFRLMCEKELALIQKLKIEGFDLRGSVNDLTTRLNGQSVYLMCKQDYNEMAEKANKYNMIENIISNH